MNEKLQKLVLSAMFLAIGIILPFFTGQIPKIGQMLLPMHIPVILCGFICGWQYGAMTGFVLPLMRFFMLQKPPMPTAAFMAFELCTYGLLTGIVYSRLMNLPIGHGSSGNKNNDGTPKKKYMLLLYITLIITMLGGRAVNGIVEAAFYGFSGTPYTFEMFMAASFTNAFPGIILQFILIPTVMAVLDRLGLLKFKSAGKGTENI